MLESAGDERDAHYAAFARACAPAAASRLTGLPGDISIGGWYRRVATLQSSSQKPMRMGFTVTVPGPLPSRISEGESGLLVGAGFSPSSTRPVKESSRGRCARTGTKPGFDRNPCQYQKRPFVVGRILLIGLRPLT